MKKRILCAIMSAVMIVGVMTGCGSKETSSNKTVENASEKTEDKYAERMEAYLDYFQSEEKDYDGVVGAAITLDSDSLPLLWLAYAESEDSMDIRFQLCSYEKNKIEILAEKGIDNVGYVAPYIADGITGLYLSIGDDEYSDNSEALIYNHEDQDFDFYDADYFEYDNYKNDDVEEYYKKMKKDIDAYRVMKTPSKIIIANTESKTAYLGMKDSYEIYSDMLSNINALEEITTKDEANATLGYRLQEKFTNDKSIKDIFDEYFFKVENKNYDDYGDYYNIKSSFTLPDGTETDDEGFYKYYDLTYDDYMNLRNAVYDDEPVMSIQELAAFTRFTNGKDAEFMMRNLIKDSAYTSFDLMVMLGKLNDDIYDGYYSDLQFGDIVEAKDIFKDVKSKKDNSVDSTESIRREDSTEISKETNNTMPAWKQAYIDYISGLDGKVTGYKFVDVNSDGQPELCIMYSNGNSLGLLNYTKSGDIELIPALGLVSNFSYGDNKIMDGYTRNGTATDYVYSYNSSTGEFDNVFDGGYDENYTDGTTNNYRFLGQEITETTKEEYESKLKEAKGNTDFTWLGDGFLADDVITAIQNY